MRLVDLGSTRRLFRPRVLERVPLVLRRVPEDCVVDGRDGEVLYDPAARGKEAGLRRSVREGRGGEGGRRTSPRRGGARCARLKEWSLRSVQWVEDEVSKRAGDASGGQAERERTLTLELCGMAAWPPLLLTTHSHTPKSFLVMGFAARSHTSAIEQAKSELPPSQREATGGNELKSPTRQALVALGAHSRYLTSPFGRAWRPYDS